MSFIVLTLSIQAKSKQYMIVNSMAHFPLENKYGSVPTLYT